jgi:hypothetical protein
MHSISREGSLSGKYRNPHVDLPLVQSLHHVVRPHLAQKEAHARDAFPKGVQYGRGGFVVGRRYEPQRQSPDLPVADTLNRADGLIQLHKYPPRFLQQ